ncbi:MAG: PAS domain-containing protein, partial [Bacteroidales bacterium]|nr:PAS domain-containing protein [Bacteroidales bacterium]
ISFFEIIIRHYNTPVLYFINLCPIIIGLIAYFISNKYAEKLKALNKSIKHEFKNSQKIFRFVEKILHGDIDAKYNIVDENDALGQSVLDLRDYLKTNIEEDNKRRKEDEQRNWISEGLAKFGEILRKDIDKLEDLSYNLISNLVKYIDANQGAFFIINDENKNDVFLEMTAQYAYERRKFADNKIPLDEGLLGACIFEKNTIFMTDVPDSFVNITSGLGEAVPRCILIVPLKINDEVHGVIEIGALKVLDKVTLEFVENVAESIASTISNVKINSRTAKLLKESQEQAEMLSSQEEEMRQDLEELQATQEEAARQSEKFVTFTNAVNHTLIRAEYSAEGILIYANTTFIKKLGYDKNSDVEGKHISKFIDEKDRDWFNPLWDNLSNGGKHFEGDMKHITKQGKDLWTMSTYTCMRNEDGTVDKILFLAMDTTEQKKQSLDFKSQINALNIANIKGEFLPSGDVLECNRNFVYITGYSLMELKEKTIFDFIARKELNKFKEIWNSITNGETWEGVVNQTTNENKNVWVRISLSPVKDMYDDISKVIYLGNDVTKEMHMEMETIKQTKLLKEQEQELQKSRTNLKNELEKVRSEVKKQFAEIEKGKIKTEKMLEGASDAIVTIDKDGIIRFFNKSAEELWGVKRGVVLGRNVKKLFPKDNYDNDFIKSYIDSNSEKIIGERKEIDITNNKGEEINVIIILSQAKLKDEVSYTAFIQNISIDLF